METTRVKSKKRSVAEICKAGKTGARRLCDGLIAEGVTTIFGYPGGAIMPIYDALYDVRSAGKLTSQDNRPQPGGSAGRLTSEGKLTSADRRMSACQLTLRHILVRHEQGAIHAAQGYARASGKVGVVFATSGPGATNLVTGLADALIDSTPIVCITGQVYAHLLGSDAFQETDIINITTPVTKWNYQIIDANEITSVIKKAFHIASSGRPGPVLIDITKNAQLENVDPDSYRE